MKKVLLLLFCFLSSIIVKAQLDTEHWFAPMYDGQGNGSPFQYLHLSTNEATPFQVSIYSNNVLITQAMVSKGLPTFVSIPRENIIVNNLNVQELFTPISKGIWVKGEKRFFANLRFGVINHAEIITSKGAAGLGKTFFTANAPNQQLNNDLQGFAASFIATEDNTTVKIEKFNKNLSFTDGISRSSISVILNRGQSYIIDGRSNGNTNNLDGFIGTKIESDKPISVTNGNFNGQYIAGTVPESGSDILMDQSVPVDKLGNEFGIIKGYGQISTTGNGMERVLIVATEDNTSIYLNGSTTPTKTINQGEYYFIDDLEYKNRGKEHYNLHIKTTKNVYAYQFLGGVEYSNSAIATGGMNYIPPLNCYLPRTIDEIGDVNYMGNASRTAKLNIITQKSAIVTLNGRNIESQYGPYPLENAEWETYSIPDVRGNLTINSTKAVTAGIAGGDGYAEGYGGYFAGFSSIPMITKKTGYCLPNIILELPDGFNDYIWEKKNIDGSFSTVSVGNYIYKPTEPGFYRAKVQQGSCEQVTTAEFKLLNCHTYTSKNEDICDNLTISSQLTLSLAKTDVNTIKIINEPTKGTISIDQANNHIIYTANKDAKGLDSFRYTFCGEGVAGECEEVLVNINIKKVIAEENISVKGCRISNTEAVYDLTKAKISNETNISTKYFVSEFDAENNFNEIQNKNNYSTSLKSIFAKTTNSLGCHTISEIRLEFAPEPEFITNILEFCDSTFENKVNIDIDHLTKLILKNYDYFTDIKYYKTALEANSAGLNISGTYQYSLAPETIYLRINSPDGCDPVIFPISLKIKDKVSLKSSKESIEICDENLDGIKEVKNLGDYKNLFTDDNTVSAKFYLSKQDALSKNNEKIDFNINKSQIFYVVYSQNNICDNIAELEIKIKTPKASTLLKDQEVCLGTTAIINAGSGFDYYKWSNGEEGKNISSINGEAGEYWVELTTNNCVYRQYIKVTNPEMPVVNFVSVKGSEATIDVSKGKMPYQYSLDKITWQTNNIFTNLARGLHSVYVKSADNCEPVAKEFLIINLINTITPNGDGYNDVLDYSDLRIKKEVSIQVFDRKGLLVYQSNGKDFVWDGKLNGRPVSTDTYWYIIKWVEPDTNLPVFYNDWILIKNR